MIDDKTRQENFEKLKKFLNSDMSIKNSLLELAPTEMDNYNENSKIKYVDRLYEELRDIEFEFSSMCKNFSESDEAVVEKKLAQIRENLAKFDYSSGDIRGLYQENFSDMSEDLIEDVKNEMVGYYIGGRSVSKLVQNSKSINELLHILHSYVMNNDEIMQSMPIIKSKENNFKYPIVLYGEETELSRSIFESFPNDLDVGWTDIVSMKGKTLMMVRDRGHALTIEIDEDKDSDIIKYFVPKICNLEMTKQLPGIGKITHNGARGVFEISKDEVAQKLFDFIGKVPMDSDIPIYDDEEEIFNAHDAKKMAMDVGENGIKRSDVENLQLTMREAFGILKGKLENIFSKDKGKNKGENPNDELSRDE